MPMNRESYDAIALQWDTHRVHLSPAESRVLSLVAQDLMPGATILDLGCGTGRPVATHCAALGFRVHGVDQSPAMLALAQSRLPEHRWTCAEIEHFAMQGEYAGVIAWDSLFHIPREHHAAVFARVRRALPDGGRIALTAGGSEHPAFTDTMFDHTFFYDSHPPTTTASLLERAGFRVVHQEFLNQPDGGRDKGRIAIVAAAVPGAHVGTRSDD